MRKLITLCLFTLFAIGVFADEGVWVEFLDGTKQGFLFVEKPKITYTAENLVMTTGDVVSDEFPLVGIARLYFADDVVNSIDDLLINAGVHPIIRITSEGVSLFGYSSQSAVTVSDASGRLLSSHVISSDGSFSVNLSSYHNGIYLIKVGKTTIKIKR